MVTYQTAYLKRYYPTQFFAALLTYETNNTDKMALYIEEAKSLGIEVLPPDIALSHGQFTPTERGILFGLNGIKGVGEKAVQNIEESRPFSNLQEFIEKVDINKVNRKVLEQLIKAGAMDRFGYTRQTLFRNIDRMLEYRRKLDEYYTSLNNSSSLFNGFGEATPPPDFKLELEQFPEWDTYTLLENEYSALGFYVSGHPLDPFRDQLKKLDYNLSSEVKELIGGEGLFVGKVAAKKRKISRKGTPYLSLTLVDYHGKLEIFLFREVIDQLEQLDLEKPIAVKASVDGSGDKVKLVARKVMGLEEAQRERKGKKRRERQIFYRLTPNYKVELAQIARQLERWQEQYPGPDEIKIEVETPFGYLVRFLTSYRLDWESLSKLDTSHLSPLPIFKG
jgi:DNA polymerase-3 subunit alpha